MIPLIGVAIFLAFMVIGLLFSDDDRSDKYYHERKTLGTKFHDKLSQNENLDPNQLKSKVRLGVDEGEGQMTKFDVASDQ